MNNKLSEELLYGQNKIIITLLNHTIAITNDNENIVYIDNPKILAELMTSDELKRYYNLKTGPLSTITSVDDVIVRDKVISVLDFEEFKIVNDLTPAGCIKWIADAIFNKSYSYLANFKEEYLLYHENVLLIEQIAAVVSKYLNIPYTEVILLPVNEIFKLHAVAQQTFPHEIKNFAVEEEEDVNGGQ